MSTGLPRSPSSVSGARGPRCFADGICVDPSRNRVFQTEVTLSIWEGIGKVDGQSLGLHPIRLFRQG